MVMQKGEVWWATLPASVGSGPGGRRPVVIVQADKFTQSRIRTVIVVILTTNLVLAKAPGNVFLPQSASGLNRDSVANISQVLTVDKTLLTDFISVLPDPLILQIEEGLKLVLGLL
jgi:mRNA interferase MazF